MNPKKCVEEPKAMATRQEIVAMASPRAVSIFNQVLGPVMRGPSSSHTAGAYHISSMAR